MSIRYILQSVPDRLYVGRGHGNGNKPESYGLHPIPDDGDWRKGRKSILASDKGYWWETSKKEAPFCSYASIWMGEFPYSSFCWAVRLGIDGSVESESFDTEINGRGLSPFDQWIQDCKSWVPES